MRGRVYLIGAGMGNPDTLTAEAKDAISQCQLLLGAGRLLDPYMESGKELAPLIPAAQVAARIAEMPEGGTAGVLLSGDVGFYSGERGLVSLLEDYEVICIPGVSSLAYFCARLATAWQDVFTVGSNSRDFDAVEAVRRHEKTFFLAGGEAKVQELCAALAQRELGEVRVWVGERLSYPEERIRYGTAEELAREKFDPLAVMLCANPNPVRPGVALPGLSDEDFIRGNAPMTGAEVRTLAIARLRLAADHVLWDVGAGTGSVAVEGAMAVPEGQVLAVERESAALELLAKNKDKFALPNLKLVAGEAPDALLPLPAPDRVFLEGTGGRMAQILPVILEKNPRCRVVAAVETLEGLSEAMELFEEHGLGEAEISQISVSRARRVGEGHRLLSQDPVWLLSGEGTPR